MTDVRCLFPIRHTYLILFKQFSIKFKTGTFPINLYFKTAKVEGMRGDMDVGVRDALTSCIDENIVVLAQQRQSCICGLLIPRP